MISEKDVLKIARLAKLSLSPEEIIKYQTQLTDILKYTELLNELDTEGIEPVKSIIPSQNIFREDISKPGIATEEALKNAPARENNMFKVPKI